MLNLVKIMYVYYRSTMSDSNPILIKTIRFDILDIPTRNVTVYQDRAEVNRLVELDLKKGFNELTITNFSQQFHPSSLHIDAVDGKAVICQIKIEDSKFEKKTKTEPAVTAQLDCLRDEKRALEHKNLNLQKQRDILDGMARRIATGSAAVSTNQVQNANLSHSILDENELKGFDNFLKYYDQKNTWLDEQFEQNRSRSVKLDEELETLTSSTEDSKAKRTCFGCLDARKKIIVRLHCDQDTKESLNLTYMVSGADWKPIYEIYVDNEDDKVTINYFANIKQRTGEDWNDCKLSLSTTKPELEDTPPKLEPAILKLSKPPNLAYEPRQKNVFDPHGISQIQKTPQQPFSFGFGGGCGFGTAPNGSSLFGVARGPQNVGLFGGTTPGPNAATGTAQNANAFAFGQTSTSLQSTGNNNQQETLPTQPSDELETESTEASLTAVAKTDDATLNTSFEVSQPVTILSDDSFHKVTLTMLKLPYTNKFIVVPSKSTRAYRQCEVLNKTDFPILAGEASLFVQNRFSRSQQLEFIDKNGALNLALGVDSSLKVDYKTTKAYNTTDVGMMTKSCTLTCEHRISLHNTKQTSVLVTVIESLPVSNDKLLKVTLLEPNLPSQKDVLMNKNNVEWSLELNVDGKQQLVMTYQLEYPMGEQVPILENDPTKRLF